LYFKANTSTGTFSFSATEVSNFEPGTQIFILNKVNGEQQLISDGSAYTFTSPVTQNNAMFSLIFRSPGAVTGINNTGNESIRFYGNTGNQITVTCNEALNNASVSVYNAVGQKVANKTLKSSTSLIDVAVPGIYMVTVKNNGKEITGKVIVK